MSSELNIVAIQARGEALRFRLRLDPVELQAIAWERVLAPIDGDWLPLAASAVTPFSRYVLARNWDRPMPVTERPLRLLTEFVQADRVDARTVRAQMPNVTQQVAL